MLARLKSQWDTLSSVQSHGSNPIPMHKPDSQTVSTPEIVLQTIKQLENFFKS